MICDYKQKFKTDFGKLIKSLENQSAEQIRSAALDYLKAAKQNAQDAGYSSINDFLSDWAKFVDWRLAKSGIEPMGRFSHSGSVICLITSFKCKIPIILSISSRYTG